MFRKQRREGNITQHPESPKAKRASQAGLRTGSGALAQWGNIVCLLVMLGVVVWSLEQAAWVTPHPSLVVVLAFALLAGLLLVRSRLPDIAAHALAVVLGAGVALWQSANLLPEPGMTTRIAHLIGELQSWWQAASSGEPSPGTIQVALMFSYLTWLIGYVSTWFVLRRQNPWVAVFLGALGLLINLSNLTEKDYGLFLFYLLAAMFLVAQTTWVKHYSWFRNNPGGYPRRGMSYFLASVFCISTLALSLAWLTPEVRWYQVESLARAKTPWRKDVESYWRNFFATVRAIKPILVYSDHEEIHFGGSLELSDQVLFIIDAERPNYWRTHIYDIYTPQGWQTSGGADKLVRRGAINPDAPPSSSNSELIYTVIPQVYTDVLLTTGELVSSSIPMIMKTMDPPVFNIDLSDSSEDSSLPPDIASLAGALRAGLADKSISESELTRSLPDDLRLVSIRHQSAQISNIRITRIQSEAEDAGAFFSPRSMEPNQRYTITAQVPSATPADLSEADEDYPRWVTDRYLQLPNDFPERVRQLAETVTRDTRTPYDKAVAIREYLSQIPYSLVIQAPGPGADGVEHFLFDEKAGYCTYFASAMAVMLRSVGVPTRISVGYLPGHWDADWQGYIIMGRDFHAWPEIYFPGYGWIGFEATPGGVTNEGDEDSPIVAEDVSDGGEDASDEDSVTNANEDTALGMPSASLLGAILGITLLILVLGIASYRTLSGFAGLGAAGAVYARMCLLASVVKLGPKPHQTTLEYSTKLSAAFPQHATAIGDIAQAYVTGKYSSNKTLGAPQEQRVRESWRQVRRALLKRLFRMK